MKKSPLLLLCCAIAIFSACKHHATNTPETSAYKKDTSIIPPVDTLAELDEFIKDGYEIKSVVFGELDKDDKQRDAIILQVDTLEDVNSDVELKPRIVQLLVREANGKLKLVMENEHCVWAHNEGGLKADDPFGGFVVRDGYFTIDEEAGLANHWNETLTTFHYDGHANWWLSARSVTDYKSDDETGEITQKTTYYSPKQFGKIDFQHYNVTKQDKHD